MSKKKIGILIGVGAAACAGIALFVIFGIHRHEWAEATCTKPETCVECGETRGEALGHTWEEATCTKASVCSVCGETKGEPLGHTWKEATCTRPATCSVCGETEGEALGHTWTEANYQEAATCSVCGEKEGEPLAGGFEENQIPCVFEQNKSYDYVTSTMQNPEEKARGSVIMSGYRNFDSDETHPALEGYEWVTARFELVFGDKNSWKYGNASVWSFTDYYTPELCNESMEELEKVEGVEEEPDMAVRYTVNYYGKDYDQCIACFTVPSENDMKYAMYSITFESCFRVPKGYDGMVVVFFDPALTMEEYAGEGQSEGEQPQEGQQEEQPEEEQPQGEQPEEEQSQEEQLQEGQSEEEQPAQDTDILADASACIRIKKEDSASGFPGMTVLSGIIPVQPGEILQASSILRNDAEYKSGFYGMQKVAEFGDYDKSKVWNRDPAYEVTTLTAGTELMSELEIPEEEGIYEVTAVAADEVGNAVISRIVILVDGTGPRVHVPKERVTLRSGDVFAPMEGVYGEDSICPDEDCYVSIDEEELQKLADGMQRGKAGTYNLTYSATDLSGNVGEKTIKVTLSRGGSPSGGGQQAPGSGGGNQQASNSGDSGQQTPGSGDGNQQGSSGSWDQQIPNFRDGGQQPAAAESQFMEDMAKEAFDIVNQYRAAVNLEALTWNESIYEGTKIRAQELVSSFSHTRPNGESCFTVISGFMTYGENIAYGQRSASQVCDAWYNSEGHRNNMLNASFTQGAIACWYENGIYYWVNLFGG